MTSINDEYYGKHGMSADEQYRLFKRTLHECSSELLSLSDDMFAYYVFEELPIDMITYVYKDTLKVFMENSLIDENIYLKSIELREYYMSVEQGFKIDAVKESRELKHIIELSDEILKLLYI